MSMKDLIQRFQPFQLYVVLILSICYFLAQLFLSYISHALTLLIDSYHMLCNIIALSGCILTIKHSTNPINDRNGKPKEESRFVEVSIENQQIEEINRHEMKLRNTFGWTRIDVLTMFIVYIFLASLSFSLLIEALQTLVHIEDQDSMHHPIPILILCGIGLILNGLCYFLIGGYTLQGSFLHITSNGDVVVLDRVTSTDNLKPIERRLSETKREKNQNDLNNIPIERKRQSFLEMFRDISSTIFAMICAIIIYLINDEYIARHIDPILSICSCTLLLVLSYPYMKESCFILLQTIPATIDIEIFKKSLLSSFTDIVNVHDLHIWQLTASKYVSTVHIIFQNPLVYTKIMKDVKNFFHEQGITIVTIQPEFKTTKLTITNDCLFQCHDKTCMDKHCCRSIQDVDLKEIMHSNEDDKNVQTNGKLCKNVTEENKEEITINNIKQLEIVENITNSCCEMEISSNDQEISQSENKEENTDHCKNDEINCENISK